MSASALRRKPGSDKGLTPRPIDPPCPFRHLRSRPFFSPSHPPSTVERSCGSRTCGRRESFRRAGTATACGGVRGRWTASGCCRGVDEGHRSRTAGAELAGYALGLAYNAVAQEAVRSFEDRPADAAWRQLLIADSLLATGHLTDAFVIYRSVEEQLPSMVTIHESVAQIYERSGHAAWAATERTRGVLSADACATRKALCEFRAGRYRGALEVALGRSDAESRYWLARIARELARASVRASRRARRLAGAARRPEPRSHAPRIGTRTPFRNCPPR